MPIKAYVTREQYLARKARNAVEYRKRHPDRVHALNAKWRKKNHEKVRKDIAKWHAEHKEEEAERKANLYEKNKEEILEEAKKKYHENPEIWKSRSATYRANNPEKARAAVINWHKKHPGKKSEYEDRRRAKKAGASMNDFTATQWFLMKLVYEYRCIYCNRHMQRLTKDHLVPIAKYGDHTASNIVPCCQSCNSIKKDGPVLPIEYKYSPMTACA